MELPTLQTERLLLRPFTMEDAKDVQRLAGEKAVSDTALNIPYPYEDGIAENWIKGHKQNFVLNKELVLAITDKEKKHLIGAIGIIINKGNDNGALGYWIGVPFWNKGYCTEAGKAIVEYAFNTLKLHRIHASYFPSNPASGKVMLKIGMKKEGHLQEHVKKGNEYKDVIICGILRTI